MLQGSVKTTWCNVIPGDMLVGDLSIAVSAPKYVSIDRWDPMKVQPRPMVLITWMTPNGRTITLRYEAYADVEVVRSG